MCQSVPALISFYVFCHLFCYEHLINKRWGRGTGVGWDRQGRNRPLRLQGVVRGKIPKWGPRKGRPGLRGEV